MLFMFNISLCLNDRQPVKVLNSLNDRYSDAFLKFEGIEGTHSIQNYHMSIYNHQAIQESCIDRRSDAWLMLCSGS